MCESDGNPYISWTKMSGIGHFIITKLLPFVKILFRSLKHLNSLCIWDMMMITFSIHLVMTSRHIVKNQSHLLLHIHCPLLRQYRPEHNFLCIPDRVMILGIPKLYTKTICHKRKHYHRYNSTLSFLRIEGETFYAVVLNKTISRF